MRLMGGCERASEAAAMLASPLRRTDDWAGEVSGVGASSSRGAATADSRYVVGFESTMLLNSVGGF